MEPSHCTHAVFKVSFKKLDSAALNYLGPKLSVCSECVLVPSARILSESQLLKWKHGCCLPCAEGPNSERKSDAFPRIQTCPLAPFQFVWREIVRVTARGTFFSEPKASETHLLDPVRVFSGYALRITSWETGGGSLFRCHTRILRDSGLLKCRYNDRWSTQSRCALFAGK